MSNTITALAQLMRSLALLAILGIVSAGAWLGYRAYDERARLGRELEQMTAELASKSAEVDRLTKENQKLNLAMRLLKIDQRVAEIIVLDQAAGKERPSTRFEFAELTKDGTPVGEKKVFTVEGDTVYVNAWVIKYDDELIERGDPLRSTSVCLFRRVFGEFQNPSEGFVLDSAGSRPAVYSQGNEMPPMERDIWANFWEYANNPAKAKQAGVRRARRSAVHAAGAGPPLSGRAARLGRIVDQGRRAGAGAPLRSRADAAVIG